jgi:hypothetical protein
VGKDDQVNAGFRLPVELVEWLDTYASFLGEERGFSVSRTQALISIISSIRPTIEKRMAKYKLIKHHGFASEEEYNVWDSRVSKLYNYMYSGNPSVSQNKALWDENNQGQKRFVEIFLNDMEYRQAILQVPEMASPDSESPGDTILSAVMRPSKVEIEIGSRVISKIIFELESTKTQKTK